MKIKSILDKKPGSSEVTLFFSLTSQKMRLPSGVLLDDTIISELESVVDKKNITIKNVEIASV